MARKKKKKIENNEEGVFAQAIDFAANLFKKGSSESYTATAIKSAFPTLTEVNVQLVIHKGSQQIAEQFTKDRHSVVSLHVKRYNQEIDKLLEGTYGELLEELEEEENDETGDRAERLRKRRIYELLQALDVLTAKERVLQLHTKENQVRIFNKLNVKIKQSKVLYDLSGFSLKEKVEFLALIAKSKPSETEVLGIKLNDKKDEVTEEAEFTIVEEQPNIEKIKKLPVPEKKPVKPPVVLVSQLTDKLQNTLKRKAMLELRRKNGLKGGPHIVDATKPKK